MKALVRERKQVGPDSDDIDVVDTQLPDADRYYIGYERKSFDSVPMLVVCPILDSKVVARLYYPAVGTTIETRED